MIREIRKKILSLKGKNIKIYVDIGRNKNEIYEGKIIEVYRNVWLMKTKNGIKSFSYSDILIKNVILGS